MIKKLNDRGFQDFPEPWNCRVMNYNDCYDSDCYARICLGVKPDFVQDVLVDIDDDFETIAYNVLEYVGDLYYFLVGWHIMPGYIRCRDLRTGVVVDCDHFFKQIVQSGYGGTEKDLCDAVQSAIVSVFEGRGSAMKRAHKYMVKSFEMISLYENCNLTDEKKQELDAMRDPWGTPSYHSSDDYDCESEEERESEPVSVFISS